MCAALAEVTSFGLRDLYETSDPNFLLFCEEVVAQTAQQRAAIARERERLAKAGA